MGLQFYRNPDEVDAENAAAAKLDRATAQRRSAIRREPSIRPRREQSSFTNLSNIIRGRYDMQQLHSRLYRDNDEADTQIAQLEAELQALRRQRERTIQRMERHRAYLESERPASLQPPTDSAETPDTSAPHDPTLTVQESQTADGETHSQVLLPRPTRESNLRFEMAATSSSRPTSPQHASAMPSPPRSVTESSRGRPVDGPLDSWDNVPPLSRGFAPARAAFHQAATVDNEATDSTREVSGQEHAGLETPPPETWEHSYPPLRRVPHMSPRPLPRTPVDGLGDRHRSPSPASEDQEEGTWNHLLSTINHDDDAPSTSTSFASLSDLLSTSRSSSYRSSNTQNTSTSFGEIGSSSDETCDLPPGITEADVRQIRERHRRSARQVPRRHIPEPSYNDRGYSVGAEPVGGRDAGGMESAMSRLLMEQVEHRLRQDREGGSGSETVPRLDAFHDILERMQRREHVPDELWTVVGLSPDYFGRT